MSTFQITGVRMERASTGTHDHIGAVQLGSDPDCIIRRQTVAQDLRSYSGDRYYTFAGGVRADVILDECPHCTFQDYITTEPDSTTQNNLLSLPRV